MKSDNNKVIELRRQVEKKRIVQMKENTRKSLKEVEKFLENWRKVLKGIKLYNILK